MNVNFTPFSNFWDEGIFDSLDDDTNIIAARMNSTVDGRVALEIICTGRSKAGVQKAVAGAPRALCMRLFGVKLPAEDIFDVREENGLYFVLLA